MQLESATRTRVMIQIANSAKKTEAASGAASLTSWQEPIAMPSPAEATVNPASTTILASDVPQDIQRQTGNAYDHQITFTYYSFSMI